MRVPRDLKRRGFDLSRTAIALACVLAAAAVGGQPAAPRAEAPAPVTILDLQPFRTESTVQVQGPDGTPGSAVWTTTFPMPCFNGFCPSAQWGVDHLSVGSTGHVLFSIADPVPGATCSTHGEERSPKLTSRLPRGPAARESVWSRRVLSRW